MIAGFRSTCVTSQAKGVKLGKKKKQRKRERERERERRKNNNN